MTYSIMQSFTDEAEFREHQRAEKAVELSDCVLTKLKNDLRQIVKYESTSLYLYSKLEDSGVTHEQIKGICIELQDYMAKEEYEFLQDSVEIR